MRQPSLFSAENVEPKDFDGAFAFHSIQEGEEDFCAENDGDVDKAEYPANISVEKEQYSFFELKRMLEQYNELILNPDFQRKLVWNTQQKSELIESILMNIPLPLFYFSKNRKGVLVVVDGLQRLNTVFSYLNDEFSLGNLKYLTQHRGKKFSQLDRTLQAKIEKYQILVYVIGSSTPEKVKLDVFDRINRGGTPLNKQEMRNALYMGKSTRLLAAITNPPDGELFLKATGKRLNQSRMKDRYLVLRFLSFYLWKHADDYDLRQYKIGRELTGDFDDFLARYMQILNVMHDEDIQRLKNIFQTAMWIASELYGDVAFTRNHDSGGPLNLVLFESLAYCFSHITQSEFSLTAEGSMYSEQKQALRRAVDQLVAEPFFQDNLRRSPNSMRRFKEQFNNLDQAIPQLKEALC